MRLDKEAAVKLRLQGESYSEIRSKLGIPKSTLSSWFSKVVIRDTLKKDLIRRTNRKAIEALIVRNKKQTSDAIRSMNSIRRIASGKIGRLTKDSLFSIGISLYWAEGYKRMKLRNGRELTSHPVSLTNTDPQMVKFFIKFLLEICNVPREKIKANLRLFKHINEKEAIKFWAEQTGIAVDNFGKTYYGISRSSSGKKPFSRLPYGIIQVRVYDTKLFHRIIGWITGLKNSIDAAVAQW